MSGTSLEPSRTAAYGEDLDGVLHSYQHSKFFGVRHVCRQIILVQSAVQILPVIDVIKKIKLPLTHAILE